MGVKIDINPILSEITSAESAMSLKFAELIFEKYIETKSITELHHIQTGVKCGTKIPLADKGKKYGFMKSKDNLTSKCDFNDANIEVKFSAKKWDTHEYNAKVTICKKNLDCDFKAWFGVNCQEAEDTEDAFIRFLLGWMGEALIDSHWTKVWFAVASLPETSGLYGSDGLFPQMLAIATTGSKQRIDITENTQADYATQLALDPQRAFEVYSAMHDKMITHKSLRSITGLAIETTEDLAVNYLQYLRNNNQVNCCYKADVTQGLYSLDSLNIFGLPIRIRREWDGIIQGVDVNGDPHFAELNDGTKFESPHRAVLTYKDNIPVGTCNADKLDDVEVLYNPHNRELSISAEYEIGATLIVDEDFILAM